MYFEFVVGEKTYKLRLTVKNIVALEKRIGKNPLMIFGNGDRIPTVDEMVLILHYSLLDVNANINLNDSYGIFQEWLMSGHIITDFIEVITDIYKVSGIITNTENEKN